MTDRTAGCAYRIDDVAGQHNCGALRQSRSSYCAHHHEICHMAIGSRQETGLLKRFEYLADYAGKGRRLVKHRSAEGCT